MTEHDETPYPATRPDGVPESSEYARWAWSDVTMERLRQDAKWGVSRNLHPSLWLSVLVEEVGEVAQALLKGDRKNYRQELVQVAAVALAALQDWDWQQAHEERLPAPQAVPFAWERAEGRGEVTAVAPTVPDWPALEREARRVAIAKAPVVAVQVVFKLGDRDLTYVPWDGQVYGSLAVVKVGPDANGKNDDGITGYQLIHVPTGAVISMHRRATPLRVLALALNGVGLDWESLGLRGLRKRTDGIAEEARVVIQLWREHYD